jgi:hypothetical protein
MPIEKIKPNILMKMNNCTLDKIHLGASFDFEL